MRTTQGPRRTQQLLERRLRLDEVAEQRAEESTGRASIHRLRLAFAVRVLAYVAATAVMVVPAVV